MTTIMEQKVKHTTTLKLPIRMRGDFTSEGNAILIDGNGIGIVEVFGKSHETSAETNAAFIVKAVNSHEAFVEALRGLTKYVESLPNFEIKHQNGYWVKAKLALKQAEEV